MKRKADQRNYDSVASEVDPRRWEQSFKPCENT